jgi:hypothetical protein
MPNGQLVYAYWLVSADAELEWAWDAVRSASGGCIGRRLARGPKAQAVPALQEEGPQPAVNGAFAHADMLRRLDRGAPVPTPSKAVIWRIKRPCPRCTASCQARRNCLTVGTQQCTVMSAGYLLVQRCRG